MGTFEIREQFYLNHKPFKIISGAIHYFRVVPEYWRDRLEKLKAMGCNTVEIKQQFVIREGYSFVQGGHLGYMDEVGVFVNRKIIQIEPDIYVVVDECYGKGEHVYKQYFHFNESGMVGVDEQCATYKGNQAVAQFNFLSKDTKVEIISSQISRNYNEALNNTCVQTTCIGQGMTSLITVIQGGQGRLKPMQIEKLPIYSALKEKPYPDNMAEGIKIKLEGKTYLVVVCHQEVNSPTDLVQIEDCMGYGNVIIFEPDKEQLVGTVLNW